MVTRSTIIEVNGLTPIVATVFDLISEHALISGHPLFPKCLRHRNHCAAHAYTVFDLISEHALISGHPFFFFFSHASL